jgi:hypothetical protein
MLPALDLDPVSEPAAAISRDAWRPSLPVPAGRRAGTGPARSRPARTSLSGMASTRRASSRARLVLRIDSGSLRRSSPSLTSMSKRRTRPHALPSNRTFDSASSEAIPGKPSRIVIEACCDQISRLHTKSVLEGSMPSDLNRGLMPVRGERWYAMSGGGEGSCPTRGGQRRRGQAGPRR